MFYEYAMDPKELNSFEAVRFFHAALGFDKGRLLARFPESYLEGQVPGLAEVGGSSKVVLLDKMLRDIRSATTHRDGSTWNSGANWLDNTIEEHHRIPFRAILAKGEQEPAVQVDPDLLTDRHPLWKAPSNKKIPKEPGALADSLALLLRESHCLCIADPYLRGTDRWMGMVGRILETFLCRPKSKEYCRASLYFTIKKDRDQRYTEDPQAVLNGFKKALAPWRKRASLELHLVYPPPQMRFHNRYLITEKAGVCLHVGMDEGHSPRDKDLLGILSQDVLEEERAFLGQLDRNRSSRIESL